MKLPLWRLIAAIAVIATMLGVLFLLAPVYLEAYQLRKYARGFERPQPASDDAIRAAVLNRAHQLDLPVRSSDIQITHDSGQVKVRLKYAVQMDLGVLQIDLHP